MEYELEEVERDYIEFRKEIGEYKTEVVKSSPSIVMMDTIKCLRACLNIPLSLS